MNLEIKEKKVNKLTGRTEIEGKLTFEGATPSNDVLKDKLAAELNKDKELIIVKNIYSKYSHQEADFLVYVYDNKESLDQMEVSTKHLRKKAGEAAKKEGEAAEEKPKEESTAEKVPKEEKPAEETPKEEAPVEEKKEGGKE